MRHSLNQLLPWTKFFVYFFPMPSITQVTMGKFLLFFRENICIKPGYNFIWISYSCFFISNNTFEGVTLMDLLLTWFTKFNNSCSLEKSQEDMLKSIVKESVFGKLWKEIRYLSSNILWYMNTFVKDVDILRKQCVHHGLRFYQFLHLIVSAFYFPNFLFFQFLPKNFRTYIPKQVSEILSWFNFI